MLVGAGGGDLMLAGLTMLCAHAMFKAALFMVVGIIDHATGTRDIRRLAWLGKTVARCCSSSPRGATASMAALPPFLGFVAKEADFETLMHSASLGAAAPYVLAGIVAGSVFTTIYSLRFLWGAFARKGLRAPSTRVAGMHRPSVTLPDRPGDPGGRRAGVRPAARPAGARCSTPTPNRCPAVATITWRCGTAGTCRCCCRRWCWRPAPRRSSSARRLPRTAVGYLPLGNADRIYDAPCAISTSSRSS